MPAHRYVEENGSDAMLATKRSAGVAQEVNLKECVTHTLLPSVHDDGHYGFKTLKRHHQEAKSGTPKKKKTCVLPKILMTTKIFPRNEALTLTPSRH